MRSTRKTIVKIMSEFEANNLDEASSLTQIDANNLQIGMYVSKLDIPWLESSFLFQGFELKSQKDVEEVQRQCQFVFIDITKQRRYPGHVKKKPAKQTKKFVFKKPAEIKSDFQHEYDRSQTIHVNTRSIVKSFMEDVAAGDVINAEMAKKAVSNCVSSIMNSPDALMWLTQLKNKDEYTSQHSMNVCIFSIALGRQIGLPESDLQELGLCGMMHDMGKMKVPLHILNKPGKFEPDELAIMQSHPTLGYELLKENSGMPQCVVDAAYGHHERLDGNGYPQRLMEFGIPLYTRIVTIADTYDAITSDRIYKAGKSHLEAIEIMTKAGGNHLDLSLVEKFIESLGIYPPGNIVEMTNGQVAIVVECNRQRKLKPKIIILLNESKQPIKPRLVDLAKIDLDSSGKAYSVKRIARAQEFRINLNKVYELDIINKCLKQV